MRIEILKALACESRIGILQMLAEPTKHFGRIDGFNLENDGVWNKLIAQELGIGQVSVTLHMKQLMAAGLVTSRKAGTRCFYKRDETGIGLAFKLLGELLGQPTPTNGEGATRAPSVETI